MERLDVAFAVVVVATVVLGGVAAVQEADTMRAKRQSSELKGQLGASFSELSVNDDELRVTVTLRNPTEQAFAVRGGLLRAHNASTAKLTQGPAKRIDDGADRLPPGGSVTIRYAINLNPAQADDIRAAIAAGDLHVTIKQSMSLRGAEFTVVRTSENLAEGS